MILLIDMDNTLVNLTKGMIEEYEKREGIKLDPPTHFKFEKAWEGLIKPDVIEDIMQTEGFFLNLEPMPGALEACRQIENMGIIDFHICTAPKRYSTHCVGEKWEWIKHYLGHTWTDRFAAVHDKTLMYGDILLDDHPEQKGRVDPSWTQIYYDQPYNRDNGNHRRITWDNWPRLLYYWKEIEEEALHQQLKEARIQT